ncbi:hypothetical protein ACTXT7_000549 [Hymenolepis weldensis]
MNCRSLLNTVNVENYQIQSIGQQQEAEAALNDQRRLRGQKCAKIINGSLAENLNEIGQTDTTHIDDTYFVEDNDESDDGEGTDNQISNAGDGLIDNENNDNDEGEGVEFVPIDNDVLIRIKVVLTKRMSQ